MNTTEQTNMVQREVSVNGATLQTKVLEDICPENVLVLWMEFASTCIARGKDTPSAALSPAWRKRLAGTAR